MHGEQDQISLDTEAADCPAALARLTSMACDLLPRTPPPHRRRLSSFLSRKPLTALVSLASSFLSSLRTSAKATTAAVFLWTTVPSRALFLTMLRARDEVSDGREKDDGCDRPVRDAHLAAEGREEDDELDRVDVVGDGDERRLLVLDQADDVVQAVLDVERCRGR